MGENNIIVKVSEGKLRGKICQDYNGRSYYSFQGIPFAKPPLGTLRFKPPQPSEKWEGVRDATQEGAECYSKNLLTNMIGGSEDCLFLNVYTPQVSSKELAPILFWIHGGAFTRGSGGTDLFGPDYLVEKGVVLVTINYRLGVLGFLAFSDPTVGVTGNAGLKDTVMALKWVQKNIRQFSGNPRNVTICGESAGGSAVHMLVLSPMAKGLFHKAIFQSGSALNWFTRSRCSYAHELAQILGIDSNNDKLILSELQKVPVDELYRASRKIKDTSFASDTRPFVSVIEPKTNEPGFLTEEPLNIIKSGRYNKVPMIIGYNTLEGIFIYMQMKNMRHMFFTDSCLVPNTMNLRKGSPEYKLVAEKVRAMYGIRGDESTEVEEDLEKGLKIHSHTTFMIDVSRSALLHFKNNKYPIYFYRFNLDTKLNIVKLLSGLKTKGAAHADDLSYLFTNVINQPPEKGTLEYKLIQTMTRLWTNFCKHGNPTPAIDDDIALKWEPATLDRWNYLSMENEQFQMLVDPEREFVDFWDRLYREKRVRLSKL